MTRTILIAAVISFLGAVLASRVANTTDTVMPFGTSDAQAATTSY
ncbi:MULTISPECIES: hypothetical protein [unclassified Novosphingobium]|nr:MULTISPECIES: hypothetical protein [unclassified Novosphingobium]